MATPLQSFLVQLGFNVDQAGLRRFNESLVNTHKVVRDFAITLAGMATAAEESIRRVSRQFENLFYLSQQTGVSVRGLKEAQFAFQQIGLSAGDANSALVGIATSMRDNPGLRALANSIAPGFRNAQDVLDGFVKQYRALMDRFGENTPELDIQSIAIRRYAEMLGISAEQLRQMAINYHASQQAREQFNRSVTAFGFADQNKAALAATELGRSFNRLWTDMGLAFDRFITDSFPALNRLVTDLANWMEGEGATKVRAWAKAFEDWLSNKDNIKSVEDAFKAVLDVIAKIATAIGELITGKDGIDNFTQSVRDTAAAFKSIADNIDSVIKAIKWLADPANTPEWFNRLMMGPGIMPQGGLRPSPEYEANPNKPDPLDPVSRWMLDTIKRLWFGTKPEEGPGKTVPIPPPDRHSALTPSGIRARPAAYTNEEYGGGGDVSELLLRGLTNWWSGSSSFRPIVAMSDDYFTRLQEMLVTLLFGSPAAPEGAGAGGAGGAAGGAGGGRTGGRFGGMGPGRAVDVGSIKGNLVPGIIAAAKGAGASDAVIQGLIAAALGEGGVDETWKGGDFRGGKATSFGPWQLHQGGELDKYLAQGGKAGDVPGMVGYILKEMNARMPGFSALSDPAKVVGAMHDVFRDYGASARNLPGAKELMERGAGGGLTQGSTGRFSAGSVNLGRVNQALVSSLQAASAFLPEGFRVQATSGERTGGLAGSQHHGGQAMDVQIVDAQGNAVTNRGADTSGMYTRLAHAWFNVVSQRFPSLASRAAWGGEFGTSPGSQQADLMHFDFGGRRGHFRQGPWHYIDSDHKVEINVHGATDPQGTARAVHDVQGRESAIHSRNLRAAIV